MYARTTHATLLERLADARDAEAWREFADRYGELIRGFGRRRGLSPNDCDDLVQDVITNFLSALPGFRYDPEKGRFRGYLKTIAVRAILRRSCQKGPARSLLDLESEAIEESSAASTDEQWESEWRQYHLRTAMRVIDVEFSSADRAAFQRYAVDGVDAKATAEAVGMKVEQVYQAKSRIMRRLSQLIAEQTRDEG